MKTIDDIRNVLIIGAGTLGLRIALRCAFDGYKVKMFDLSDAQIDKALAEQASLSSWFLKKGLIDVAQAERAKANLSTTSNLDQAIKNIDLISESIFEDIDVKREFYAELTPRLDEGVIVTTNTSFLLPSNMLDSIQQPDHFCALHFHDVFHQIVVDVMPHPSTAPQVIELLMAFGRRVNQIPVFIGKENPGYIFNAILSGILTQAGHLAIKGVGSIEDIDRSFMGNFKTPAGPFGMMDHIGLDTALRVIKAKGDAHDKPIIDFLNSYIEQGKLGYKTGAGFYSYPSPEYTNKDFLRG